MNNWQERSAEAQRLGPLAGNGHVDERLLELLLDPQDTAVSQAAADALLARRDVPGLRLYAHAFGTAEEDTRNKLGDCLYDDQGTLWADVRRLLPALGTELSEPVRRGAEALLSHMRTEERGPNRR
jgi:hypothetical protein